MDLQQKTNQNLQQIQRLIMSPAMQQAVHLMQLPVLELQEFLETSLAQNPVIEQIEENAESDEDKENENEELPSEKELDFSDNDFSVLQHLEEDFRDYLEEESKSYASRTSADERLQTFLEQSVSSLPTLFEHLKTQSEANFNDSKERAAAEAIIGNLDEFGYLHVPIKEIATLNHIDEKKLIEILKVIQTFEPYGIAANDLQECLLIQLKCWGKQESLAAQIVENYFDDLLHNRIPVIVKGLQCAPEAIAKAIRQDLSRLDLRPGAAYSRRVSQTIVPDATLHLEDGMFRVEVNSDYLPPIRINHRYLKMALEESVESETKQFIHKHVSSAKWLLKNIQQRNDTLERVVKALSEKQKDFFSEADGKLAPLTMGMMAQELSVHESTIARAVANKYVQTPRGLLALRSFFSNAYTTDEGKEISSGTVREVLQELIDKENKSKPFSDEGLAKLLKERGIPCARRTVAKYRSELNLGNAQQRKKFLGNNVRAK